jgi:hypothetical protein
MIFRPEQVRLMALGMPAVPANGGGSSDSSNQTTTNNVDQRLSNGSGVGATASSGGTVTLNVSQLDGGAIQQAFGLGHDALAFAAQEGTASMSASAATAQAAINGMYNDVQSTQQAYADATQQVVSAYQDAKTGNQKTMMVGVLLVAAIAVAMPFLAREAK